MLKRFLFCIIVSSGAFGMQQSCTAKANECKDPVANAKHYPQQHCTCFTCEKGSSNEKILCTNDNEETRKLQARADLDPTLRMRDEKKEAVAANKGKSMSLTGWIKTEGGNTSLVIDKDKQTWNISNPDAVKGHEGHHVRIKAMLNEADHSVNVESLSMLSKRKQTSEMQKQ